ncbi:MAG: sigma-70 family RNA polymerase sigma factor [Deltaproteobacteria bacterium]|nr:sigma-70 family RNA polymerase sigma factor [Deltaproteobacteria bacterium]
MVLLAGRLPDILPAPLAGTGLGKPRDLAGLPTPQREDDLLGRFAAEMSFLYGFVERMGLVPADRDDIIQEVFLVFHRRRADFDHSRPLRPWLAGIAYRLTLAQRRTGRELASDTLDPTDERSQSPEQDYVERESAEMVRVALQKLPPKQRAVFIMHEIAGLDVVEVARAVGVPRFTVYSRLREGRRAFSAAVKRLLEKDTVHES